MYLCSICSHYHDVLHVNKFIVRSLAQNTYKTSQVASMIKNLAAKIVRYGFALSLYDVPPLANVVAICTLISFRQLTIAFRNKLPQTCIKPYEQKHNRAKSLLTSGAEQSTSWLTAASAAAAASCTGTFLFFNPESTTWRQ